MLDTWRETFVFLLCSLTLLVQNFNKVCCSSKGWLLKSWRWELPGFEHEWVSSLEDKPPSEPQNGVQNSQKKTGALIKGLLCRNLFLETLTWKLHLPNTRVFLCTYIHCLQEVITTPEGGSWVVHWYLEISIIQFVPLPASQVNIWALAFCTSLMMTVRTSQ